MVWVAVIKYYGDFDGRVIGVYINKNTAIRELVSYLVEKQVFIEEIIFNFNRGGDKTWQKSLSDIGDFCPEFLELNNVEDRLIKYNGIFFGENSNIDFNETREKFKNEFKNEVIEIILEKQEYIDYTMNEDNVSSYVKEFELKN